MIDKQKKLKRRCLISEEDTSTILQRYPANTVLKLLQEIAQNPGEKLDWNMLVKKTATGISNAREYQILWRHLAYRFPLLDNVEDGAQPLDDDSDLECELEAFPDVSSEATSEAAACVKVLIASGAPSESNLPNSSTVEAPLTINVPNQQSFRTPSENSQSSRSMQGTFITVPISVQKQPLPTITSSEVLDTNGLASGSIPVRRKRKPWSTEEDDELKAAVKKFGEGNWTNIVKGELMWGRTASQLSQRWAILKKKDANLDSGGHDPRLSEAQQAARHAMSVALNGIKSRTETCINSPAVGTTLNTTVSNSTTPAKASLASSSSAQGQTQTQKGPILKKSSSMGQLTSTEKFQVMAKKPQEKSDFVSDSMVRATAVAAGARIATASDAALLLKAAAQSKNAVHIKSSLSSAPFLAKVAVAPGALRPGSITAASPTVKQNPSTLVAPAEQTTAVPSSRAIQPPSKNDVSTMEANKFAKSGNELKEKAQADGACAPGNNPSERVREDKASLPNPEAESKNQVDVAMNPGSSTNLEKVEGDQSMATSNQIEKSESASESKKTSSPSVLESDIQAAVEENSGTQNTEEILPSTGTDGCCKNVNVANKAEAANKM